MISYVGKDAITLLADTSLEAEGEVVAADHDAAPKALLERLHVRLNTREVQSLTGDSDKPRMETGSVKRVTVKKKKKQNKKTPKTKQRDSVMESINQ